ncbi:MAG: YIP1 family protein [Clostridia bacterium]|nr:YIP1 family protein [Clostridia bacterium]
MKSISSGLKKFGAGTVEMFKRLKYAFYILAHPIDGFFDLKNDPKRRTVSGSIFLLVMLAFSSIVKRQLTGYLFTESTGEQLYLNVFMEVFKAVAPFLLFTIANWCFTSLMDGDGSLKDIFCATAFATLPMTICNFLLVPISNFVSLEEESIYVFIVGFSFVWCYGMVFLGMMVTHQYSVSKAIATAILSIVGILVIIFIAVLVFYLVSQVVGFISSLYTEISFRLNE